MKGDRDIPASEIARWLATSHAASVIGTPRRKTSETFKIAGANINLDGEPVAVSGVEIKNVWLDEYGELTQVYGVEQVAVAMFENPNWPSATTCVFPRKLDKHDPRNPNPAAGSHEVFVVRVEGQDRDSQQMNLSQAKVYAQSLHMRLVAALIKEEHAREMAELEEFAETMAQPGYGRF